MVAEASRYLHADLTRRIIGAFFDVYRDLGHGFAEPVYERALADTLADIGLAASRQPAVEVWRRGRRVGRYRADLVVAERVILELKAARTLEAAHPAQLLNLLRATRFEVGLLLNFGPQPEIKRLIFSKDRKRHLPR